MLCAGRGDKEGNTERKPKALRPQHLHPWGAR